MRIRIEEDLNNKEPIEVVIHCQKRNEEVEALIQLLAAQEESIVVFKEKQIKQLPLNDIFYFETVDNKTFVYSETEVYQTNLKLYELEGRLTNSYFIRTSKSLILNVMKIKHVTPAFNSRFEAELENKEKIIISRKFAPLLKKKLGI